MSTVSFKISGEYITNQARIFVTEDNWETALRLLNDDMCGSSYEIAVSILKCEKQFVGTDEIDLVDDDPSLHKDYIKQVDYLFSGIYKRGNEYWRPYAIVTGHSELDMNRSSMVSNRYHSVNDVAIPITGTSGYTNWCMARNTFYMDDMRNDIAINNLKYKGTGEQTVLWQRIRAMPLWIPTYGSWQEALNASKRNLKKCGAHQYSHELDLIQRRKEAQRTEKSEEELEETKRKQDEESNIADRIFEAMIDKFICQIKVKRHSPEAHNGWLSPKGFIIECNYASHENMACAILRHFYNGQDRDHSSTPGDDLIKRGWHKLQNKDWLSLYHNDFKVTQAQYNTIWDYTQFHKTEFNDCIEVK